MIGKLIGALVQIAIMPFVVVFAIPIGVMKAKREKAARLLFTGDEQSLLGQAQRAISMDESGMISPDRDLVSVARCVENARIEYQTIKGRERFDATFSEFLKPQLSQCSVGDWGNVFSFFKLSDLGFAKPDQSSVGSRNRFSSDFSLSDSATESLDELLALLNNTQNFSIYFSTSTKRDAYASSNEITRAELQNITELDIYQPSMDLPPPQGPVEIPSAIGQLANLKKLSFREFKIASIPASIAHLSELEELHVSRAGLTSVPNFLVKLPKLKILSLPANDIVSLPSELGELQTLEELILPLNEIEALPESISDLKQLKTLRLASNPLLRFPECLRALPSLEGLSIDDDELGLTEAQRAWLDRMYEDGKMLDDQYPYCFKIDPTP